MALNPMQTLILWSMLAKPDGGGFQKDIRPIVKKPDRDALVNAGLIASAKRGKPGLWLEATDKGWAWAAEHLDAELPKRTTVGGEILQAWLTRLKAFLAARDFALADVLGPQPAQASARASYDSLRERIREAYFDATGAHPNQRVFLDVLRGKLRDIDRASFDETLRKMHLEHGTHLSGSDNPPEITPAIREASLDFKGERMVALWITQ